MRHTISKMLAAFAVVAASAAPAIACGGPFASGGCSPCGGQGYVSPCAQGYDGYGYGPAAYERLPEPAPVTRQYFYANQGPILSGPGMFAPAPTYQETAVGYRGYPRYDGGPYANPIDHYTYVRPGYYAEPGYAAPAVYSYRPRVHYRARPSYRYGYGIRPRMHYGYAQRGYGYGHRSYVSRAGYRPMRAYTPRVMYAPRHGYQGGYHGGTQHQRPMHRPY